MSQFVASVREAEERLAGLAKALQSAWDEEVAEASTARESARRSLIKATAVQEAAAALGRKELVARVDEVVEQLRTAEAAASRRLEELVAAERSFQNRLSGFDEKPRLAEASVVEGAEHDIEITSSVDEPEVTSEPIGEDGAAREPESIAEPVDAEVEPEPEIIPEPVAEEEAAPERLAEVEPEPESEPEVQEVTEAVAEPVVEEEAQKVETPKTPRVEAQPARKTENSPAAGLNRRVIELERVAARLPVPVFEPALEELVALSRLLAKGPGVVRARQAQALLGRLRKVAASRGKETTFGLSDDEFADWASLAADARNRRQSAVEGFKARRAAR